MTTPTLATRLPGPAEIALAVDDSDYYADVLATLKTADRAWFAAEVLRAWQTQHPRQPLTGREIRILNIAARHFHTPQDREQYLRHELGISPTRFLHELGQLIDRPEAEAAHPTLVRALRQQRAARQAARAARQLDARSAAA